LSEAKIKEGIFVGPQIRELTKDKNFFFFFLNEVELAAWTAFKDVCSNFLGNNKADRQLPGNRGKTPPVIRSNGVQHVTKDSLLTLSFGFLPTKSRCS
jgi:hypothetical protein